MLEVPRAVRVGCALNGWLAGRLGADATIVHVGERADTLGFLVADSDPMPVALFLGELRRRRAVRVSLALPVPGDPRGLGGPPAFNAQALEAAEALVVHGAGVGLVPVVEADGVVWRVEPAEPPSYLPDIATASRDLRETLRQVADELAGLDVAAWSPDAADALLNLRSDTAPLDLPVASAEAAGLVLRALHFRRVVTLALADDGGATTAAEADRRRSALCRLDGAARSALIAVTSTTGSVEDPATGRAAGQPGH